MVLLKVCFTDLNYIHCFSFFLNDDGIEAFDNEENIFLCGFLVLLALNIQLNICLRQSIWK